jgi:hypothetical protein
MDRQTANEHRSRSFAHAPLIAFVCECADESCRRTVSMSSADYAALRERGDAVLFPGHVPIEDTPMTAERESVSESSELRPDEGRVHRTR